MSKQNAASARQSHQSSTKSPATQRAQQPDYAQHTRSGMQSMLHATDLIALQRSMGNRAVQRILARQGSQPAPVQRAYAPAIINSAMNAHLREADGDAVKEDVPIGPKLKWRQKIEADRNAPARNKPGWIKAKVGTDEGFIRVGKVTFTGGLSGMNTQVTSGGRGTDEAFEAESKVEQSVEMASETIDFGGRHQRRGRQPARPGLPEGAPGQQVR